MPKLLIVDGHNLLFQMFYGMPSRISGKDGKPVQGVLGFIAALLKIVRITSPTHLLVVFDGEICNPRKEMDCNYKANRPDYSMLDDEDNPFTQLDGIYKALDFLGVVYTETSDCEADDVITAYSANFDGEVVISSYDSDFFQLISDRLTVLRYRGDSSSFCDRDYVKARYGIEPQMYAEHKCLVGDSADNIVGVKGIGPKTAASLLLRFGSLENLIERCCEIERDKIRNAVIESRDRIFLNRDLIVLRPQATIDFTDEKLRIPELPLGGAGSILREIGLL